MTVDDIIIIIIQAMAPQSVMFPGLHPAAMMATVNFNITIIIINTIVIVITCGDILKAHPYRLALAPPTLLGAIQTIVRPALVALPPFQVHPGALVSPQDPPPNKHLR